MRRDMLMIDGLQYVNWNRELFEQAQQSGVHGIHDLRIVIVRVRGRGRVTDEGLQGEIQLASIREILRNAHVIVESLC